MNYKSKVQPLLYLPMQLPFASVPMPGRPLSPEKGSKWAKQRQMPELIPQGAIRQVKTTIILVQKDTCFPPAPGTQPQT